MINENEKKRIYKMRPNKNAAGFTYTDRRRAKQRAMFFGGEKEERYNHLNKLHIYGTGDELTRNIYNTSKVKREHPTEFGYFKEFYILNETGKRKLRELKRKRNLKKDL